MAEEMKKPSGLEGVVAASSAICTVDGEKGRLIYYGYDIQELAGRASFEEVVYLLWYGELPTRQQLASLNEGLVLSRELPEEVITIIKAFPDYSNPMEVLRTTASSLSSFDRNACYYSLLSASVYNALGIPRDLFTPIFAVSRIAGWTAHVMEQYNNNRLIRPRAEYVGPMDRHYVPIEERKGDEAQVFEMM